MISVYFVSIETFEISVLEYITLVPLNTTRLKILGVLNFLFKTLQINLKTKYWM